jgi:hypothetical protein
LGLFFTARGRGAGGKPQPRARLKWLKVGAKATETWGPKLLNTLKKWGPKLLKVGAKATEYPKKVGAKATDSLIFSKIISK